MLVSGSDWRNVRSRRRPRRQSDGARHEQGAEEDCAASTQANPVRRAQSGTEGWQASQECNDRGRESDAHFRRCADRVEQRVGRGFEPWQTLDHVSSSHTAIDTARSGTISASPAANRLHSPDSSVATSSCAPMVRRWRVSHPAIVYPVAATVTAKPEAYTNLSYLRSLPSAVQKTGGDPRVYLARTHAACPIVVLLGHPRVGMV